MASLRLFAEDLINAINGYRTIHQAEPLQHNPFISSVAQDWADYLADRGSVEHNPGRFYKGEKLGENIAVIWKTDGKRLSGGNIVDRWYDESMNYDFERHEGEHTGHFRQMVWRSSRQIGVGRAVSRDGKLFVVANFYPAGNIVSEEPENVFPARRIHRQQSTGARNGLKDNRYDSRGRSMVRTGSTNTTANQGQRRSLSISDRQMSQSPFFMPILPSKFSDDDDVRAVTATDRRQKFSQQRSSLSVSTTSKPILQAISLNDVRDHTENEPALRKPQAQKSLSTSVSQLSFPVSQFAAAGTAAVRGNRNRPSDDAAVQRSRFKKSSSLSAAHRSRSYDGGLNLPKQLSLPPLSASIDIDDNGEYVVLSRTTETKTKNGVKVMLVTEQRQNADGELSTVTTESLAPRKSTDALNENGLNRATGRFDDGLKFRNDPTSAFRQPTRAGSQAKSTKERGLKSNGSTQTSNGSARPDAVSPQKSKPMRAFSKEKNDVNMGVDDAEFIDQVVRQHNMYRRLHGNVGDLDLNLEMCKIAESWARHLASMGDVEHSVNQYRGQELGENLAYKYFGRRRQPYNGYEPVTLWYDEIKLYNFRNPEPCAVACGHFTQAVWKGSREMGVGRAFSDDGTRVYVVCNYYPHGNVVGRFKECVLPATNS